LTFVKILETKCQFTIFVKNEDKYCTIYKTEPKMKLVSLNLSIVISKRRNNWNAVSLSPTHQMIQF